MHENGKEKAPLSRGGAAAETLGGISAAGLAIVYHIPKRKTTSVTTIRVSIAQTPEYAAGTLVSLQELLASDPEPDRRRRPAMLDRENDLREAISEALSWFAMANRITGIELEKALLLLELEVKS